MYRWWVFVHILGVFGFLVSHGVSMVVLFRIRSERDPRRVVELLEFSGASIPALYVSLLVLLVGGVVAGFLGRWWSRAWIWASLAILVLVSVAMYAMATAHFRRLLVVARARAGGSGAVTDEQIGELRRSSRALWVAAIGFAGLAGILYLMMFKPSLGFGTAGEVPVGDVAVGAENIRFDQETIIVAAGQPFTIVFENRDPGVPHDVTIRESGGRLLFDGEDVTGPETVTYRVPALPPGDYVFLCTIHPDQMTGVLVTERP